VAVSADAEQLDVDPATVTDLLLELAAPLGQIRTVGRREVDVVVRHVDAVEQVLAHEVAVALRMVGGQAEILVEVERPDPAEVDAVSMRADHALVDLDRCRPGREPEHEIGFLGERAQDPSRDHVAGLVLGLADENSHEPRTRGRDRECNPRARGTRRTGLTATARGRIRRA